jgi:hypothetical protein
MYRRQGPSLHRTLFRTIERKTDTEFKLRIPFCVADSEQAALLQLKELLWSLLARYRPMPVIGNPAKAVLQVRLGLL